MTNCPECGRDIDDGPACPGCGRLEIPERCARHPEREARGRCVVCETPVCDACAGDDTREFVCPAHHGVPIVDGWAQVYSTGDDVEAELIRENLRAEGMAAEVLSQKDHHAVPVHMGELSPVRVLVPARDYGQAVDVLARHMDTTGEVAFACPDCGEPYEGDERACSACGAALPRHPA